MLLPRRTLDTRCPDPTGCKKKTRLAGPLQHVIIRCIRHGARYDTTMGMPDSNGVFAFLHCSKIFAAPMIEAERKGPSTARRPKR
jgi:hypothetical protein